MTRRAFTADEAAAVADQLGIDGDEPLHLADEFRMGMHVELEHGTRDRAPT